MLDLLNYGAEQQPGGGDMPPMQKPIPANPTAGIQAPAAPPMPQIQAQSRPSLLSRIGHALAAAGGAVSDTIRPDTPAGYEGLLSPDEIQHARPSLLHSLIGGPNALRPDHEYAANLDNLIQHKALATQMQRQAEILNARRGLMERFPAPPSGSEADLGEWANKVLPYMVQSGDFEGVKTLQPLVEQFAKNKATKPGVGDPYVNGAGEIRYFDKTAGSSVPAGWSKVKTGGGGTAQLFVGPKGASQQEWVMPGDDEKLHTLAAQGYKQAVQSRAEMVQAATDRRFDLTDVNKQVAEFNKVNAPIAKAATFYPGFKAASEAALAGNPAAFKTLMSQMAAQLDPALQLRLGTLLYVQNIDPSFKGSLQRYLSEKSSGTLPPDQVRKVIQVVDAVRKEQRDLYTNRRNDLVSSFPAADKYAHSADDIFGAETQQQPTPQTGAAGGTGAAEVAARSAWAKANPPMKGESLSQYKARYEKSKRGN